MYLEMPRRKGVLLLTEYDIEKPEALIVPAFVIRTVIGSIVDSADDVSILPEDRLINESIRRSWFQVQLLPPLA